MEPQAEKNPKVSFWQELFKLVFIALVVVVPFRLFIAQPFVVDGASMDPTFTDGEYLIVDELSYHFREPERLAVVIFRYPNDPKKYFIKRIIGLPGETVRLEGGKVTIVNGENPEGFNIVEPYVALERPDTATYLLGEGEYFVMGDNRAGSADSRFWGPLPEGNIIGRPVIRLWPPALWPGTIEPIEIENAQN